MKRVQANNTPRTFATVEGRDAYITKHFPDRQCSDTPGLYNLSNGDSLGVRHLEVTLYHGSPTPSGEQPQSSLQSAIDRTRARIKEILTPEPSRPAVCPFCNSADITRDMVEWEAHSLEPCDPRNTAVIQEHQCGNCSRSFWT